MDHFDAFFCSSSCYCWDCFSGSSWHCIQVIYGPLAGWLVISFYHFALVIFIWPTVDDLVFKSGQFGVLDSGTESCEEWLERQVSLVNTRDFKDEPIFVYGSDEVSSFFSCIPSFFLIVHTIHIYESRSLYCTIGKNILLFRFLKKYRHKSV